MSWLSALNQTQDKEVELNKFSSTYPDIVLGEEIDKLHFQDLTIKQTMKDMVSWMTFTTFHSLNRVWEKIIRYKK